MAFFDFFAKEQREMTPAERRILELLTTGDAPELARLRSQWSEPLGMWVERRRDKDSFTISLIYDRNVKAAHSIGESVEFDIDDLIIIDRRVKTPVKCIGSVSWGILTNIICVATAPVRWPRYLNVDDWSYTDADGRQSQTRRRQWHEHISRSHPPAPIDAEIARLVPSDYRDYTSGVNVQWSVECDDGDVDLLGLEQLYFLDHPEIRGRFIVFGTFADASVMAFGLSKSNRRNGVFYIDVTDAKPEKVAETFTEWLRR